MLHWGTSIYSISGSGKRRKRNLSARSNSTQVTQLRIPCTGAILGLRGVFPSVHPNFNLRRYLTHCHLELALDWVSVITGDARTVAQSTSSRKLWTLSL